jgi:dihydrodipicolinate synthase/N-acetylneuraminate lyase
MPGVKLHGIFSPLTTPFAADGSVDHARIRSNIALYNKTGLAGYASNGSTGESVLLLWSEVYKIWETVKASAAPEKILIAGTGAESTAETIVHTNRAAELGFAAALVRTPSFYKPAVNDDLLAEFYLRVADASKIPVLLYAVPIYTHIKIEASLVARVAHHPNIVGMKDSSGDVEGVRRNVEAGPKTFQTLVGWPTILFEALEVGAVGAILAVADAFPELCVSIFEAARAGQRERAQELAQKLVAPAKIFGSQAGLSGLKYAMDRQGFFGGLPRPPLLPLSLPAKKEIEEMLANLGYQPAHQ